MKLVKRDKHDTNRIGEISEVAIIMRFLELGYTVLTPYGGNHRYDLVVEDDDGHFWRIQCKSARMKNESTIVFNTSNQNVTGLNRKPRNYRGQCDYFAAYCSKLKKIYFVSVDEVPTTVAKLRLLPPKNNRSKSILWAKDYEL